MDPRPSGSGARPSIPAEDQDSKKTTSSIIPDPVRGIEGFRTSILEGRPLRTPVNCIGIIPDPPDAFQLEWARIQARKQVIRPMSADLSQVIQELLDSDPED